MWNLYKKGNYLKYNLSQESVSLTVKRNMNYDTIIIIIYTYIC